MGKTAEIGPSLLKIKFIDKQKLIAINSLMEINIGNDFARYIKIYYEFYSLYVSDKFKN